MKRTEIKDLPVPEKELTESEARKIQGGIVRGLAGGTSTSLAEDETDGTGQNTASERDTTTD